KAQSAGTTPASILSGALRQLAQLHRLRLMMDEGASAASAVEGARPPLHFRRKPLVEVALKAWTSARLLRVMQQLADAVLETRKQPALAGAVAQRTLLAIAVNARRRDA